MRHRKWVGMMENKESKLPVARCGLPYPIGAVTKPSHARYALYFWNQVVFATSKSAIEKCFGKLEQYQKEDAQIEFLRKKG